MKTTAPDLLKDLSAFSQSIDKVCVVAFEDNAPPWRGDRLWKAAEETVKYLICRHQFRLSPVIEVVGSIKALIASIDTSFEHLCSKICFQCSAPCCLVADVSYDFRDLLFIIMTDQELPPGQPRRKSGEVCRYLGDAGCRIPRFRRPWICTWYLCAAQKKYLAGNQDMSVDSIISVIADVGKLRKQMENLFIDTIAP